MVPELLVLALDYRRQPRRYADLDDPESPLPAAFDRLVGDLGGALSAGGAARSAQALGCTPDELRAALVFLLRRVLLPPAASHYRALGVSRSAEPHLIAAHYRVLIGLFHPDRHPPAARERSALDTARINAAYAVLRDPARRQRYDLAWGGVDGERLRAPRQRGHRVWVGLGRLRGRRAAWRFGAIGAAGILLWIGWLYTVAVGRPSLRMADGGAARPEPGPALASHPPLRGPTARLPVASGPVAPDTHATPEAGSPERPGHRAGLPGPGNHSAPAPGSPETLLARFERGFAAGDLAALLKLFAEDARIASAGAHDPRGGGDLFQSAVERRLRLGQPRLTRAGDGRVRAQWVLEGAPASGPVGGSAGATAPWAPAGGLELEIVRRGAAYRISALDYWIGARR